MGSTHREQERFQDLLTPIAAKLLEVKNRKVGILGLNPGRDYTERPGELPKIAAPCSDLVAESKGPQMTRRKPCRKCGGYMSASAEYCPHCGHRTYLGRYTDWILRALLILFVLFLVARAL